MKRFDAAALWESGTTARKAQNRMTEQTKEIVTGRRSERRQNQGRSQQKITTSDNC